MKSDPALPGGSLTSKPTWSNTSGCSATSAFFVLVGRRGADERSFHRKMQKHVNDTERISAELKNGVVTVHLPKDEKVKPRRIEVKCC